MTIKTKLILYAIGAIMSPFIFPFLAIIILPCSVSELILTLTCVIVTAIPFIFCLVKLIKYRKLYDSELSLKKNEKHKKQNIAEDTNKKERNNNPVGNIVGLLIWGVTIGLLLNKGIDTIGITGVAVLIVASIGCIKAIVSLLVQFQDYMDKTDNNK